MFFGVLEDDEESLDVMVGSYSQVQRYRAIGYTNQMRHHMILRDKPDIWEHEHLVWGSKTGRE